MRRCSKCGLEKEVEEFGWRNRSKGLRTSYCLPCKREIDKAHSKTAKAQQTNKKRMLEWRVENRQKLLEYLSDCKCVDCGETDPVVLDFDHLGDKEQNISSMISHASWGRILQEIAKCQVRCANCHRRRTAKQFNWYKRPKV